MQRVVHTHKLPPAVVFRVGWRRLAVTQPHESPASKADDVGQMRPFYTTILFLGGGGLVADALYSEMIGIAVMDR